MGRRGHPVELLPGLIVALSLVGCTSAAVTAPASSSAAASETAPSPDGTISTASSPPVDASAEPPTCADATFAALTPAQRVGQLLMPKLPTTGVGADVREAVATWHIGNAWYGRTTAGVDRSRATSDALQDLASVASTGGVRFLIAANQEGGLVQGLSGPGFDAIPSAEVQGTWSTDKLTQRAGVWGRQLQDAGVNADFAPVADVVPAGTEDDNAPIGRLHRGFGSDPDAVASHVAAFIAGLQDAGVATTVKHFPGLGLVEGNTDSVAEVVDTVTTARDASLEPFRAAIDGGTDFVMISLATYTKIDPDHIAAFSPTILRDLLRRQLGFDGVIMSDSLSATAVADLSPARRAVWFLEAGGDLIVLTPLSMAENMARAILARYEQNAAFRDRVDDAARRVLEAKDLAGLLPCD